jgi:Zn finger protein HypA/HybF involved in hydrogenase expression
VSGPTDDRMAKDEDERQATCLDCGDEWVELEAPAICPECHSLNVEEVRS